MNLRLKALTGVLILALGAAAFFIATETHGGASLGSRAGNSESERIMGSGSTPDSVRRERGEAKGAVGKVPGMGSRGFLARGAALDMGKMGKYLSEHGNDADALAGVFCLNPSAEVRSRLIELAKTQPVAAAVLAGNETDPESKLKQAKQLIAMSPDNGLGYLLAADAELAAGNKDSAMEMMKLAGKAPAFDAYFSDLSAKQDAAWKAEGRDVIDRGLLASADPWRKRVFDTVGYLALRAVEEDGEDSAGSASEALDVLSQLKAQTMGRIPLSSERQLLSLESMVLSNLPPDFEYGESTTVGDYLRSVDLRQQDLDRTGSEVYDLLEDSSGEIHAEFYKKAIEEGELAASAWLLGRKLD